MFKLIDSILHLPHFRRFPGHGCLAFCHEPAWSQDSAWRLVVVAWYLGACSVVYFSGNNLLSFPSTSLLPPCSPRDLHESKAWFRCTRGHGAICRRSAEASDRRAQGHNKGHYGNRWRAPAIAELKATTRVTMETVGVRQRRTPTDLFIFDRLTYLIN